MHELASYPIGAVHVLMELLAKPSLVVLRNMGFILQFPFSMRKRTLIVELTKASLFPVPTDLSLILDSEALGVVGKIILELSTVFAHLFWIRSLILNLFIIRICLEKWLGLQRT